MGLGLDFAPGEGPRFAHPVRDESDVAKLAVPDMDSLRYVFDAVRTIRRELDGRVPLIGFAGSPWTIACYMAEGRGSDDYRLIKSMLYGRPDLLHRILEINAEATRHYLNAQIDAGAQAVMLFDSWGGVLADGLFQQFSLAYTRRVVEGLTREREGRRVPVIVFTKGGGQWLEEIAACGCDAVGLDWTVNLGAARRRVTDAVALQGNLDPMTLFGGAQAVRAEARRTLDAFGPVGKGGHVFNLGHGISQYSPPEVVSELVDEVHTYSRALHAGKWALRFQTAWEGAAVPSCAQQRKVSGKPQNLPRSLENIYKLMNTKEKYELIADAKPSQAGTTLKAHTLVSVFPQSYPQVGNLCGYHYEAPQG